MPVSRNPNDINNDMLIDTLFIARCIDAGVPEAINQLSQEQPISFQKLLIDLRNHWWQIDPAIADGFNQFTLRKILDYMSSVGIAVVTLSQNVPDLLNMSGPPSIEVTYNPDAPSITITWSAPADTYQSYIALNGVIEKKSQATDQGNGFASDTLLLDESLPAGDYEITIAYADRSGGISRLSKVIFTV